MNDRHAERDRRLAAVRRWRDTVPREALRQSPALVQWDDVDALLHAYDLANERVDHLLSVIDREVNERTLLHNTLVDARAEIDRWGYGDMHYGATARDPKVLAMLAKIDEVLGEVDATQAPTTLSAKEQQ